MTKSVLSIQSHVVHGYVGNRAATFPLQVKGWDVDALNTVQLSNHTGYGKFRGRKMTAEELWETYKGLRDLSFQYDGVLTGYTPNAQTLSAVKAIGCDIKSRYPQSVWILDPVMGDGGQLYVDADVVPIYKEILKSGCVDVITPNSFEAELLTGIKITDVDSAKRAIKVLHEELKVPDVIITSCLFPQVSRDKLYCFVSNCEPLAVGPETFCFQVPIINGYFTGTGDLFAAMVLDGYHKYRKLEANDALVGLLSRRGYPSIVHATRDTLSVMHLVLERTRDYAIEHGHSNPGIKGDSNSMRHMELRVVACADVFLNQASPREECVIECNAI